MKVQFIYTFEEDDQEIYNLENLTKDDIKYKPTFIDIATSLIEDEEKRNTLVKLSCSVTLDENENINPPEYYIKANGKFYFENGLLIYNP